MHSLKNKTIGQLLKDTVSAYGNRDAVVYSKENIRYTYDEFYRETTKLAKALIGLGVKKAKTLPYGPRMFLNGCSFSLHQPASGPCLSLSTPAIKAVNLSICCSSPTLPLSF